ncbi:MAG: hypothetical protein ACYTDY_17540 [Planctomycetota bacterium]
MSKITQERERLKRILELSDRLGTLRRKVTEGGTTVSRKDLTEELRSIAGSVVSIGLPGALGRLAEEQRLGPHEVMALLLLLHRRLEPGPSGLTGREILSTLFPSAFGILSGITHLAVGAPLRTSGALVTTGPIVDDCLEATFELSDRLFRAVERDVNPRANLDVEAGPSPYGSHWEHLADLGRLSSLLLRRSHGVFDVDPYGTQVYEAQEPTSLLDRRALAISERIRQRLARTPGAERYPIVRLAKRMKLSEDEQLVLATLLFQQCYYGSPGLEAVELLRMVSHTPEDLLKKNRLLASDGHLRREGLVEVEDPLEEKELSAELSLPRWVASFLLGEDPARSRPIGPDTRLEFHEYLKGLGDSDQFFRDLDK